MAAVLDCINKNDWKAVLEMVLAQPSAKWMETQLPDGRTLVHLAAQAGEATVLEAMLSANGSVNQLDNQGFTPLHYSVTNSSVDCTCVLLRYGANVNHFDDEGLSPLHHAALLGKTDQLHEMLRAPNANVSIQEGNDELSLLHTACLDCRVPAVEYLVQYKDLLNLKTSFGDTALHLAACVEDPQMAAKLAAVNIARSATVA